MHKLYYSLKPEENTIENRELWTEKARPRNVKEAREMRRRRAEFVRKRDLALEEILKELLAGGWEDVT